MEGMEEMDRKQPDAIGKNRIEPKVKSIHSIHCLHCSLTWLNQMAYGRDTLTQRFTLSKHRSPVRPQSHGMRPRNQHRVDLAEGIGLTIK